jgi:hypothetical protein
MGFVVDAESSISKSVANGKPDELLRRLTPRDSSSEIHQCYPMQMMLKFVSAVEPVELMVLKVNWTSTRQRPSRSAPRRLFIVV